MGIYLNSKRPFILFQKEVSAAYFVDKTDILAELVPLMEVIESESVLPDVLAGGGNPYICITRPRRFGKTVMANLIASYFGKGADSSKIFDHLKVSDYEWYRNHLNKHNVIHISLNECPDECSSYQQYISRIKRKLLLDLKQAFPDVTTVQEDALWDVLNEIVELRNGEKFIFVLDEWDYIFHQDFADTKDQQAYLKFLSNLLKDQPYVELAYMTGILPIAKYSSGSELNMFYEYTMVTEEKYSEYFGFTEEEVDDLYQRFQSRKQKEARITRAGLQSWYNGYHTKAGQRVYNPRSVVAALNHNNLGSYWTSSGPYDEIFYYVKKNIDDVRDAIALLISGVPVAAKVREYAAVSMNLSTKNEIFSAMVVYGFLNYEAGCVSIPNQELMQKFADMIEREPSLGYVHRLAKESERMLQATKELDTETMVEILEYAHHTESPLLHYNNETELTMIVNMVYLSARDTYRIEREEKAGIGFADFLFYPLKKDDDCIILELKVNHTAKQALDQIRERNYALNFQGKLGESTPYSGRILAVGIGYDPKKKKHSCRIEILRGMESLRKGMEY